MIDDPCRMPRKREQPRHINAKLRQIGDRKRHPAERNNKQYIKMTDHPAYFLQKNNKYDLLKHQANTAVLHNAPDMRVHTDIRHHVRAFRLIYSGHPANVPELERSFVFLHIISIITRKMYAAIL